MILETSCTVTFSAFWPQIRSTRTPEQAPDSLWSDEQLTGQFKWPPSFVSWSWRCITTVDGEHSSPSLTHSQVWPARMPRTVRPHLWLRCVSGCEPTAGFTQIDRRAPERSSLLTTNDVTTWRQQETVQKLLILSICFVIFPTERIRRDESLVLH